MRDSAKTPGGGRDARWHVNLAAATTAALLSLVALPITSASAATLQPVGTFDSPVYVTSHPDDPNQLFVVEQGGEIELVTPAGTDVFLTVPNVSSGGEHGLFSVAFPPDYAATGLLYVYYTGNDGDLHIDEFTASSGPVDPATRREVLHIPHPTFTNHNGGQLQFGPDGYLYAGTGDGGGGGDPDENAQNLNSLLGKLLRIDPRPSGTSPYTIPADNPFVGTAGRDEIWAYGFRNPWRFSFDRTTGDLLVGDVGQGTWEEVDYAPASAGAGRGVNFGWDCREGAHDFEPAGCTGPFTDPIFEYSHTGGACSITGGYVSRDPAVPELAGRYLYADLCLGEIRSLTPGFPAADDRSEGLTVFQPSSFGEDSCGRLYVASLGDGTVFRLAGTGPTSCAPPPEPPSEREPQPPPITKAQSLIRLRVDDRRVVKGDVVKLAAKLHPCPERAGNRIMLLEHGEQVARKRSSEFCRAIFRQRIRSRSRFRAKANESAGFLADRSDPVKIRIGG
jgi:Glucose / Sorbosone dehydrogenase